MKNYLFISFVLLGFQACTVTPVDPTKSNTPDNTTSTSTNTSTTTTVSEPNPLKDVCSYGKDQNKGCLKFVIGTSNLTIGPFHYDLGVAQFAKEFMNDVALEHPIDVGASQRLQMSGRISTFNFFDNFYVTVEGGFSTYPATNVGYGNLLVNKMAPGTYTVVVSKDFEIRLLNKNGSLAKAYCATIWTSRSVVIEAGQESVSSTPLNYFEYKVYDNGCNGQYTSFNNIPVEQGNASNTSTSTSTDVSSSTTSGT